MQQTIVNFDDINETDNFVCQVGWGTPPPSYICPKGLDDRLEDCIEAENAPEYSRFCSLTGKDLIQKSLYSSQSINLNL